ncbi:DUF5134 domain-containing protein [Amnibacterium endophyticum]|uniref:DUF5134 domain-containing protein n=1 Tax=Amnibacterium endophyticum TaxID=2109337 RepID=A0ABW4LKS6_9MICO
MGTPAVLGWIDTAVFTVLAAWYAVRAVVAGGWRHRVSSALHLAMSAAMAAMPWTVLPAEPQVVLFSAGALWFVWAALTEPAGGDPLLDGAHGGRVGALYHAGMMASMVWMAIAMTPASPAMDMAGHDHAAMHAMSMSAMTGGAPWATAVSGALGAGYALGAVWLLEVVVRQAVRDPVEPGRLLDAVAAALMTLGMSYGFLALMT